MLILNYLKKHFLFVPNAVYGKFFSYLYNCLNFHHYLEFNYTGPVQEEEGGGSFTKSSGFVVTVINLCFLILHPRFPNKLKTLWPLQFLKIFFCDE